MNVVFRTDASLAIGAGHLFRCMALAEELVRRGAEVLFVCRTLDGHLGGEVRRRGLAVEMLPVQASHQVSDGNVDSGDHNRSLGVSWQIDAQETREVIVGLGNKPEWLIVDHYALDSRWEERLYGLARRTMVIDDLANRDHYCDLLLDQNLYTNANSRYMDRLPSHCRQILGPGFSLLRSDFKKKRATIRGRNGDVRKLLISFGGGDSRNLTSVAIDAVAKLEFHGLTVEVVVGEQHQAANEIKEACRAKGFSYHLQSNRMADLMADADLAIGAGGSSTWERCCVGLPCLTFAVASNQRQLVADAALAGIIQAPGVDPHDEVAITRQLHTCIENPNLLQAISKRAMDTVDGRGCDRVARAMRVFSIRIRPATRSDRKNIFEWRDDLNVRKNSSDAEPLQWSAHCLWFDDVLEDADTQLLVGEGENGPVGVVRFDIENTEAVISIYMAPGQSQRGLGSELLLAAEAWLAEEKSDIDEIHAMVLGRNDRSRRLFSGNGYESAETLFVKRIK